VANLGGIPSARVVDIGGGRKVLLASSPTIGDAMKQIQAQKAQVCAVFGFFGTQLCCQQVMNHFKV
jgi:hypothetical protein